jgi:hypothetical protein
MQRYICSHETGNTNGRARLSTVDLLIKVASFVTKVNTVFNMKKDYLN